jgi:hypothetical protein
MGGRGSSFKSFSHWQEGYAFFGVNGGKNTMYNSWSSTASHDEKNALTTYTGSAYSSINKALRTETRNYNYQKTISDMDTAIEKFELKKNLTTYRGSSAELVGGYTTAKDINSNLKGTVVKDKGYVSTAVVQSSSFSGEIKYEIDVPKGKGRGTFVAPISHFKTENEFILKRGTNFLVKGATEDSWGNVTVKLKVVD